MKKQSEWVVLGIAVAMAVVFIGAWILGAETRPTLVAVAAFVKIFLFLSGAFYAANSAQRFEPGNPIRPAWWLLALGLLASCLGQAYLAYYQVVLRDQAPFPSPADVFYFTSYPLFIAALICFMRAYAQAGFPLGTMSSRFMTSGIVIALSTLAGYFIFTPIMRTEDTLLARSLNIAYPALDFLLLIPTVLLVRATLPMHQGQAGRIWLALLGGFFFMCLGDIAFAFNSSLKWSHLDPIVHATYLLSYGFLAFAAGRQRSILLS
ncbi:MAG: hypothetical protein MUF51_05825 [Vicinamibacteria bacterium]|jgi:hypothetical protein|nr:hypothetical protein [Vicinamibacteria bacterium]